MAINSRPPEPRLSGLSLPSYGYLDDIPVYRDTIRIPEVQRTKPQGTPLTDLYFGAGDKSIVGELLRSASGEGSEVPGLTPDFATYLLESWGYPTTMDALSADEWQQRIEANKAARPNPLELLGGY